MDHESRKSLSEERAERYAPAPTGGSFLAGFCGAVVAMVAMIAAGRFYGFRVQDHLVAASVAALLGFAMAFIGYKRAGMKSRTAQREERAKIDQSVDGPPSVD
jgi:hypothetical protein